MKAIEQSDVNDEDYSDVPTRPRAAHSSMFI